MPAMLYLVVACTASFAWTLVSGITGGRGAVTHSAPYIVSLHSDAYEFLCGGSIINAQWVVTAASCIIIGDDLEYIVAGIDNNYEPKTTEQRRTVDRERAYSHPKHKRGAHFAPFDIGMIHIDPPFVINAYVQSIALPEANRIPSGTAQFYGWGVTTEFGEPPNFPNAMQTAEMPIVPFATCAAIYHQEHPMDSTEMCTGPLTGGIATCAGDDGGPLSQNGQLIGIASQAAHPCGQINRASFFVRTSAFIDWIHSIQQIEM